MMINLKEFITQKSAKFEKLIKLNFQDLRLLDLRQSEQRSFNWVEILENLNRRENWKWLLPSGTFFKEFNWFPNFFLLLDK